MEYPALCSLVANIHGIAARAVILREQVTLSIHDFALCVARRGGMSRAEAASERCDGCERQENGDDDELDCEARDLSLKHGLLFPEHLNTDARVSDLLESSLDYARITFRITEVLWPSPTSFL